MVVIKTDLGRFYQDKSKHSSEKIIVDTVWGKDFSCISYPL